MSDKKEDNFLTEEDERILKKSLEIRERIIDSMTEDKVPEKGGDIRVLNEVLASTDASVLKLAELRLRDDQNNNEVNNAERAAEILKAMASNANISDFIPGNNKKELEDNLIETVTVVTGELEINPPTLTLDDIDD